MASGKLGSAALAADTNTILYTVPEGSVSTLNINVVNRGGAPAKVSIAISINLIPELEDYIEYQAGVPANGGVLERSAIVLSEGERVIIHSSTGDCSARIHGFEEIV